MASSSILYIVAYIVIGIVTGLLVKHATLEEIGSDRIDSKWNKVFIIFGACWPITWILVLITIINGEENE